MGFSNECFFPFLVYDDYKFVSASEIENLGLGHLIGSQMLRAYMHGFFMDNRLYYKVRFVFITRLRITTIQFVKRI